MDFEWDEAKEAANRAKHGIGFDVVYDLDWTRVTRFQDTRFDYGEPRFVVYLYRQERLHACVYSLRNGKRRVISLRKANKREERDHGW